MTDQLLHNKLSAPSWRPRIQKYVFKLIIESGCHQYYAAGVYIFTGSPARNGYSEL